MPETVDRNEFVSLTEAEKSLMVFVDVEGPVVGYIDIAELQDLSIQEAKDRLWVLQEQEYVKARDMGGTAIYWLTEEGEELMCMVCEEYNHFEHEKKERDLAKEYTHYYQVEEVDSEDRTVKIFGPTHKVGDNNRKFSYRYRFDFDDVKNIDAQTLKPDEYVYAQVKPWSAPRVRSSAEELIMNTDS